VVFLWLEINEINEFNWILMRQVLSLWVDIFVPSPLARASRSCQQIKQTLCNSRGFDLFCLKKLY
jgi:hypothetical protein